MSPSNDALWRRRCGWQSGHRHQHRDLPARATPEAKIRLTNALDAFYGLLD